MVQGYPFTIQSNVLTLYCRGPVAQLVVQQTREQEGSGSNLWLGQGLMVVISTGFIPLSLTAVHCFDNGCVGKQQLA